MRERVLFSASKHFEEGRRQPAFLPNPKPARPTGGAGISPASECIVTSSQSGLLSRMIVATFLLCTGTAAHAEKRVALVIGNSACQTVEKLSNPAADAKLM